LKALKLWTVRVNFALLELWKKLGSKRLKCAFSQDFALDLRV